MVDFDLEVSVCRETLGKGMELDQDRMQALAHKLVETALENGRLSNAGMIGGPLLAAATLIATTYKAGATYPAVQADPEKMKRVFATAVTSIFDIALRSALDGLEVSVERPSTRPS